MDRPLGCLGPDGAASAARALRLVASDGEIVGAPRQSAVSVKAARLSLSPGDSFDDAIARILGDCLDHFAANIPALQETGDAEAVHQLRVALRRLRAFFGLLKRVTPASPELANAATRAKAIAGALGEARDWHVFREGLERGPREFLRDEPSFFALLDAVELRRLRALEAARATIAAPVTQQFVRELRGLISRRAWRDKCERTGAEGIGAGLRRPGAEPPAQALRQALRRRRRHEAGGSAQSPHRAQENPIRCGVLRELVLPKIRPSLFARPREYSGPTWRRQRSGDRGPLAA